jgi:hypothetical protein
VSVWLQLGRSAKKRPAASGLNLCRWRFASSSFSGRRIEANHFERVGLVAIGFVLPKSGRSGQALEAQNAEFSMNDIEDEREYLSGYGFCKPRPERGIIKLHLTRQY